MDVWEIFTLAQFYNSSLWCPTFQDFRLAPTLKELAHIMSISIKDQVPFSSLGEPPKHQLIVYALHIKKEDVIANLKFKWGTDGFSIKVLGRKSLILCKLGKLGCFQCHARMLIYGIVLFPNVDNFIDMTAIRIFLLKNPISTLLVRVYHSIHLRYEKMGGMVQCWTPLLCKWFLSHLPKGMTFSWKQKTNSSGLEGLCLSLPTTFFGIHVSMMTLR